MWYDTDLNMSLAQERVNSYSMKSITELTATTVIEKLDEFQCNKLAPTLMLLGCLDWKHYLHCSDVVRE